MEDPLPLMQPPPIGSPPVVGFQHGGDMVADLAAISLVQFVQSLVDLMVVNGVVGPVVTGLDLFHGAHLK